MFWSGGLQFHQYPRVKVFYKGLYLIGLSSSRDARLARLLDEARLGADLAADDVDVREVRTSRRRRPDAAYGELSSAPAAPSTGGLTSHNLSFDNAHRSRQPIPRPYRFAGRSKLAMIRKTGNQIVPAPVPWPNCMNYACGH